jgi:hypothetical protein
MVINQLIVWGCVGGVLPDAIRLIKGRYNDTPGYLKAPMFWVGLLLLIGLGGFVAWLAGAKEIKEALAYGYGGPEVLTRLLSVKDGSGQTDRGVGNFRLLQAWSK